MSTESITEADSLHNDLEKKTVKELLLSIHEEDKKVAPAVFEVLPQIEKLVEQVYLRMKKGGRLFYIGSGTSGRLGILDASEIPPTYGVSHDLVIGLIAGGDGAIRKAVEMAEDDEEQGWKDLEKFRPTALDTIVGIAASGRTPYVVGTVKKARGEGLLTACIVNNKDSILAQSVDIAIEAIVGPEFVTGSTRMKSGTSQKLILNMISTSLMIKLGRVKGNKMVNMQLTNQKLINRGTRMIMNDLGYDEATARRLLLLHGSVNGVLEAEKG
ncbi:MAG TPA: N-acetylmuramic acid 6-phosphate etherase [Prolixibacteraceae bacterium]|nr:N-acetylmuramic acid 6-phosphate etherase [Prolixibacteraceae bacterium]